MEGQVAKGLRDPSCSKPVLPPMNQEGVRGIIHRGMSWGGSPQKRSVDGRVLPHTAQV